MVCLVSLEVILYQLTHIASPTSSRNERVRYWHWGGQPSVAMGYLSWVHYGAENLHIHIVLGKIIPKSRSEGEGKWSSEGSGVMGAGHLQVQRTDRFAGPCPWEACLPWWRGRWKEEKCVHLFPSAIGAIGQVFARGAFLPLHFRLCVHPWGPSTRGSPRAGGERFIG